MMKNVCLLLLALLFTGGCAGKPSIVSQSPYITHTLRYLGVDDLIVGVSRYDVLDLPKTGGIIDPDGEALARLSPDILFTSDWTAPEVLEAATPAGTRSIILHGFGSMSEIEQNIRDISRELELSDGEARAAAFAAEWRGAAESVKGGGKRVLILSSCQGEPFSFGRNTYLYDLFTVAGFRVVEDHPSIRHLNEAGDIRTLDELLRMTTPEIVFVIEDGEHGCAVNFSAKSVQVVQLNGEHFVYPAPVLLEGIDELLRLYGKGKGGEEG